MTETTTKTIDKTAIRDAATVVVLRDRATRPRVLMGQRGAKAAFMPNKFVFPGGAVDAQDAQIPLARALPPLCAARLSEDSSPDMARALAVAAVRELWEETGQILGVPAPWPDSIAPSESPIAASKNAPAASSALRASEPGAKKPLAS